MKQLTKEQLTDMIYENWEKVTVSNLTKCKEHMYSSIKETDHWVGIFFKLMITYGTEIKKECCQVMADTLYDILYSE